MANPDWSSFPPVRRVVTGHDGNNVAKVLIDAPATNHKGAEGRSTLMWITDREPRRTSRSAKRSRTWARASSARRRRRTARASA